MIWKNEMEQILYYAETNAICILILGILLASMVRINLRSLRAKTFLVILIAAIVFCASDLLAGVLRGQTFFGANIILWISNISYFLCTIVISVAWIIFAMDLLQNQIFKKTIIFITAIGIMLTLITLSTPWTGLMFTIDSANLYSRGDYVLLINLFNYALVFLAYFYLYKSKADKTEKMAVILYPVFPLIASILQVLFYGISTAQVGFTASILLIYVLLQGIEVNEQRIKAKVYDELARTDTLTGLNNRRSYEKMLDQMNNATWVGVIFMDLNHLKKINDEQGHEAGDRLIRNFSTILKSLFKVEEIYRISGDEFVALTNNRPEFDSKVAEFIEINNDMASFGCVSGSGKEILELIKEAELKMYDCKTEYYKRTNQERRH